MFINPIISVIIPCNHGQRELFALLQAICNQTCKPNEIVIVDSSITGGACPLELNEICASCSITLNYEYIDRAMPGKSRNIGLVKANGDFIAFIDVQTIPRPHWLETSMKLIDGNGVAGVWGATCFQAETRFEMLVRDGFYGVLAKSTLPGSFFRRDVFGKVGQFIEWSRAGEDTEWMLRVEVLKIKVVQPADALIDYVGLFGTNTMQLLKKWFRNYSASRELPHFFPQKLLVWLILYPLIVLIAFNWNYLIADWRMDSPMYLGHVTKIMVSLPFFIYILIRGLVMPLKRGVRMRQLFPIRFIKIAMVCLMADAVKILVFSRFKLKRDTEVNL